MGLSSNEKFEMVRQRMDKIASVVDGNSTALMKHETRIQNLEHLVAGANNRSAAAETAWITSPKPRWWIRWMFTQ